MSYELRYYKKWLVEVLRESGRVQYLYDKRKISWEEYDRKMREIETKENELVPKVAREVVAEVLPRMKLKVMVPCGLTSLLHGMLGDLVKKYYGNEALPYIRYEWYVSSIKDPFDWLCPNETLEPFRTYNVEVVVKADRSWIILIGLNTYERKLSEYLKEFRLVGVMRYDGLHTTIELKPLIKWR